MHVHYYSFIVLLYFFLKKNVKKFGRFKINAYLCSVKPQKTYV